jgi:hypothetical protein
MLSKLKKLFLNTSIVKTNLINFKRRRTQNFKFAYKKEYEIEVMDEIKNLYKIIKFK